MLVALFGCSVVAASVGLDDDEPELTEEEVVISGLSDDTAGC